MYSLIKFGIRYPIVVNVVMLVLLLIGFLSFKSVRYTFFPNIPVKVILVDVLFPGASVSEVEEGITYKIEEQLEGVDGIDRVLSSSFQNRASVMVEMKEGFDENRILQEVKNAVDKVNNFPQGIESPIVYKQEQFNFAISFAISGKDNLLDLKRIAEQFETRLRRKEGISQINLSGFPDREIEIAVNESNLERFELMISDIHQAVQSSNLDVSAGSIKGEREEFLIRASQKGFSARELENIVVRTMTDGSRILLKDVAQISDSWAEVPARNFAHGEPSVVFNVLTTKSEDILFVVDEVKKELALFGEENPQLKTTIINDYSVTLNERIQLLAKNGVIGAVLILIFLAMFLHYRLAFWVALGIPISFLSMFIFFQAFGYTINVISLFGMIIVIGILVDDGVIISENIYRHYEMGKDRIQAAIDGTFEVLPSIISAILTTVIMFSIFFFLSGRVGEVFGDISFVVITTLLVSLVEALFILPAHVAHSKALARGKKKNRFNAFMDRNLSKVINKVYGPMLRFIMKVKVAAPAVSIFLFIVLLGFISNGLVKTTFFPVVEQDNVQIELELPVGTSEDLTIKKLNSIRSQVVKFNEDNKIDNNDKLVIKEMESSIGPLSHQARLNLILQSATERNLRAYDLISVLRKRLLPVPGAESVLFTSFSPFGKPVSISLTGENMDELRAVKSELIAGMESLPEVKDITQTDEPGKKEIRLKLKDQAHQLGISLGALMGQIRAGFFGSEVQALQMGDDEVKVWVRYDDQTRRHLTSLDMMRIRTPNGAEYFLQDLAEYEIVRGPLEIKHLDGLREIRVESEISNSKVSVPDLISEIRTTVLPPILERYPGVSVGYEGQSRETAKTAESASKALPVIFILVFAIIALVFRSFSQTFAVLLLIPFSLVGVIFGHWVHGAQIGVLSALGIVALIGVLVNDSLVFISTYNKHLKNGQNIRIALFQTGKERFRPILLTTVTTVAGLSPLILEKSFQAQFLVPMAISLSYGLMMAMFLTLFLLPSLLLFSNDIKFYFRWLWTGKKPNRESLETAVKEEILEM